jgi:uncharacterized membrane protein
MGPGASPVKSHMNQAHEQEMEERSHARNLFRWLLAVFFVVAGANHFRVPAIYVAMIPPWLPWPAALNAISGACEILGGIGILVPRLRLAAGWGLVALLIAVFPANLHVALMGRMPGTDYSATTLWLRLPFQLVFVAWVAWVAIRPPANRPPGPPPI